MGRQAARGERYRKCDFWQQRDEISHLAGLRLTLTGWSRDHERPHVDMCDKHVCLAIYLKLETAVKT